MLPLALYVHLPWCVRKCPYCDFNSHTAGEYPQKTRYIDALLRDLGLESRRAGGRPLQSVFLGGGTPSLFAPDEIGRLLAGVRRHFDLVADVEITMEANPGTVECGAPAGYREAGVNRLSIGAQSFCDAALSKLGRIHAAADIDRAVEETRAAGFDNFNLDLMFALPGQDVAAAVADIERAAALQPTHISWYQLTLEPNTIFYARPPDGIPDEDLVVDIQSQGQSRLRELGYEQYEVSAWARDQRHCEHNLNYWLFGDYLAVGAGAHGKFSDQNGIWRYAKPAHPLTYIQSMEAGGPEDGATRLDEPELLFEFMLNALRLPGGFDESVFEQRTGLAKAALRASVAAPVKRGLIERVGASKWRPTALGFRFLNDLQAAFLPKS